ncbi:CHAP domain-containing protein [Novosphingobium sp. NBM11]|uniref:CHAP domain-containing protein n=1 Tax=Novosphingobium sp. NBM11 TaxID=2596914 RepID=UPI0035C8A0AD|nr:CHAP domain-containing protein [Novosphingobium sp. NBM11]
MKGLTGKIAALAVSGAVWGSANVAQAAPAALQAAGAAAMTRQQDADADSDALPYLQCVPYARQVSGIGIYGDALTWWDQAAGRYARGRQPRVGAVMSFRPYGGMELGHVAAVSRIIDSRTVLLRHANWSPINGRRGQIEKDVRAVDVSPENDWSEVRVWYAPIADLGTTRWPVNGFIYNEKPRKNERLTVLASAETATPARAPLMARTEPARSAPGRGIGADFLKGVIPESRAAQTPASRRPARQSLATSAPRTAPARATSTRLAGSDSDPIGRIIAARMR